MSGLLIHLLSVLILLMGWKLVSLLLSVIWCYTKSALMLLSFSLGSALDVFAALH